MATEKPLSVAREEFVDNLVGLINSSGLPMFVVLDVLKGAAEEVRGAAQKEYERDKKAYHDLKEEKNDE